MKRIFLLILLGSITLISYAQKNAPKWLEKSKKAVITITTYDKDNRKITSGTGFFISETGEAISAYSLFKGAGRGVVTDTDGNEYPVHSIIGADELYDVIKFKVSVPKKVTYFPLAKEPVTEGSTTYQLDYTKGKELIFQEGKITEVSSIKDNYSYYKIDFPIKNEQVNTPLLLATGEVFGLAQQDASGKNEVSYAVSAPYANSLIQSSVDVLNPIYQNIGIKKAWPSDVEQASISLFLMSSQQDPVSYVETLNDFISAFPRETDGYINRASHYANRRKDLAVTPAEEQKYLDLAMADLSAAEKISKDKADIYFNKAKLIYGVAVNDEELTNNAWSLDAALVVINQALKEQNNPLYRQLEGDIYFLKEEYQNAYDAYMQVNESELASSTSYYWAAKAKENIPGTNIGELIDLLTNAVNKCTNPNSPEAAPFILDRIEKRLQLNQYDEAITDYDLYYSIMNGNVADAFFYYREQAKFRKGDLDGALEDIQQAIKLDNQNPDYYAEEASVYTRMQKYDDALGSLIKALEIAPDFAACYRLQGVCYTRLDKKNEACDAFNKAKELGDPLADRLIKDNCQ